MKRALLTTEAIMKKVAFVFILFFALFVVSNSILAKINSEYAEALKYYNSGKYEEAVSLLKEYVKKKPEPVAYYRLGYALYEMEKYDEANEYFKEAYLINPEISPSPIEFLQKYQESKTTGITGTAFVQPPPAEEPPVSKMKQPEVKPEGLVQPQVPAVTPQQPQEPVLPAEEPVPPPALPQVEPQQGFQPPPGFPPMPIPEQEMPFEVPGFLTALLATFGVIFFIIGIAFYIYISLCQFLIAKKLNVTWAWAAWIPIINSFWPFVGSAGKPWWWILLLIFVPIVNFFLFIYLWMLISENLGRNKWLGLLILVPIVNFVYLGILAFSKTESVTTDTYGDLSTA
jgi:hypothetical protein